MNVVESVSSETTAVVMSPKSHDSSEPFLHRRFCLRGMKRGFTLIEIAVVIFIIGIMVAWALSHLNGSIRSANSMAVKQQVLQLEQVAHAYGANTVGQAGGPYAGLGAYASSGYIAGSTSLLPEAYTASGIPNAFGGMGVLTNSGSNYYVATVIESGVPTDLCTQLANFFSNHSSATCSGNTLTVTFQ